MKRMVLGLSLSLAAFGFLMSPTLAAASSTPAAPVLSLSDQAFLASLAPLPAGAPAPELAANKPSAKKPAFGVKSFCSANCWNGGTVSCSGSTCSAVDGSCPEPGHVTCDGVTTSCSACTGGGSCGDPDFCTNAEADCAAGCAPCSYFFSCNENTCHFHCGCGLGGCPP
jgi:hypothetical protein